MSFTNCKVEVKPDSIPVVKIAGEINYKSAPQITDTLTKLHKEGHVNVALDCRLVDFVDSSGIGAIVQAAYTLQQVGGSVRLLDAPAQLVHALQISGFSQLLDCGPDSLESGGKDQPTGGTSFQSCKMVHFSIPLKSDMDGSMRRRITELARCMPFTQDQVDDIRLAVGEAISNAIRHGRWLSESDRLTVRCIGDKEKLVIKIHNPGEPFDPDSIPIPDPSLLKEGGMGIYFMKSSMDVVSYDFDETGTTVTMAKYLGRGEQINDSK